jgi:tRNA threonylcarbamoyladenosine biosynthesis protein TsaB
MVLCLTFYSKKMKLLLKETPIILHIETATNICSIALSKGSELISLKEESKGFSHAEKMIPFIDQLLKESAVSSNDLDAIAVSIGPGSYTGLRIGASTTKGLCYALDIPAISVSTLLSIAEGAKNDLSYHEKEIWFAPMIDARRMEVYTALFNAEGVLLNDIHAEIIDNESFKDILEIQKVIFCGNGMPKSKEILSQYPHASFSEAPLSAKNMIIPALEKYKNAHFEDVAYFEPFYLKEYIPGKSTVKGLRA